MHVLGIKISQKCDYLTTAKVTSHVLSIVVYKIQLMKFSIYYGRKPLMNLA